MEPFLKLVSKGKVQNTPYTQKRAADLQAVASAADLQCQCRCLLKKRLFLGRTLLLQLWMLGTHVRREEGLGRHVRKRLGRLGQQPEQLWLQG